MCNFSSKNLGFTPFMNEMRAILKPELPCLYSKLLKVCTLFACNHISSHIKLSLLIETYWFGFVFLTESLVLVFLQPSLPSKRKKSRQETHLNEKKECYVYFLVENIGVEAVSGPYYFWLKWNLLSCRLQKYCKTSQFSYGGRR